MADSVPEQHLDLSWLPEYYRGLRKSRSWVGLRDSLVVSKRDLLLFDSVIIAGLDRQLATLFDQESETVADAEYLASQLFYRPGPETLFEEAAFLVFLERLHDGRLSNISAGKVGELWEKTTEPLKPGTSQKEYQQAVARLRRVRKWLAPILASELREAGCGASPIFDSPLSAWEWSEMEGLRQQQQPHEVGPPCDLIEVVTDYIPLPGEDVPLHEILEFSRDPQTQELKQRLMRATARANLDEVTPESFALQLEEGLAAYKEHMSLLDAKRRGPVMKLVIAATGAVEGIFKLNPRKTADALLEFKTSRVSGLEAELKAAGRETAFIYRAEETFRAD